MKCGGRVFYWVPGTNFELKPLAVGSKMICQGHGCECKRQVMGPDLQRKPYGALTVQFGDKYQSPGVNVRSWELREVMELDE